MAREPTSITDAQKKKKINTAAGEGEGCLKFEPPTPPPPTRVRDCIYEYDQFVTDGHFTKFQSLKACKN